MTEDTSPESSVSAVRSGSTRPLLARGLVVAVFGAVSWITMERLALIVVPAVVLVWLVVSGPVAFSFGQVTMLAGLQRWLFWEAIAVEVVLGSILLVSLVERRRSTEPALGLSERTKPAIVFVGSWVGLAGVGWFGSTVTGNVAIGGTLMGICSVALAYLTYRVVSDIPDNEVVPP